MHMRIAVVVVALVAFLPSPSRAAPAAPPAPEQIMQIPPALRKMLREQVIAPGGPPGERLQRLTDMVFSPRGMALQYRADATHTVAETFASGQANCLSFTLLFVALAREAGISAQVQEVGQVLSWYQDATAIYAAGHVNARVEFDGRSGSVDLDQSILPARRGPVVISDRRAQAHYYNNRASELMAQGEQAAAREYLTLALQRDARFVRARNNLGVLESRQGHDAAAAAQFERALAIEPQHLPSLLNAAALHRRNGDLAQAARLQVRIDQSRENDPFQQYLLGMEAEAAGDYARATERYRRATRLYREAHLFHFALARMYFLEGQTRRAGRELQRALAFSQQDETRQRYQAKLDSLRRWNRNHALVR